MIKKWLFSYYFKIFVGILILTVLMPQGFAATVGHGAPVISEGLFESGENITKWQIK